MNDIKRTKGFIPAHERKSCETCKYKKYVGSGSKNQQTLYCTKNVEMFMITLDDICDEHKL